ncbi:MAG: FHA domain-containing protein, partial [Thermoanaerobaculia bacterium]
MKLSAVGGNLTLRILPGRTFVVGRAVDCDLPVLDPTISRHHAELQATESGLRVRDLGSTNGTCVDGERVGAALVPPGAWITFGKVDFDLLEDRPEDHLEEPGSEGPLDATILRQVRVRGPADIAARLADAPQGVSLLKIAGQSSEERQGRKLQLLLDIAKELSRQTDLNRLADKVVSLTFQMMSVDRVALMTMGSGGELVPRVWRSRVDAPVGSWRVPRSIARKAVEDRVAVLVENPPAADPQAAGPEPQTVRSALCAPLLGGQGDVLGIIYLDNVDGTQFFTEEDLDFL